MPYLVRHISFSFQGNNLSRKKILWMIYEAHRKRILHRDMQINRNNSDRKLLGFISRHRRQEMSYWNLLRRLMIVSILWLIQNSVEFSFTAKAISVILVERGASFKWKYHTFIFTLCLFGIVNSKTYRSIKNSINNDYIKIIYVI